MALPIFGLLALSSGLSTGLAGSVTPPVQPVLLSSAAPGSGWIPWQDDEDIEELVRQEREEADLLRRRGAYADSLAITDTLLDDDEEDSLTLTVRGRTRLDQGDLRRAESTAAEALAAASSEEELAAAGRLLAEVLVRTGRAEEALQRLEERRGERPYLDPGTNPLDAWTFVMLRDSLGDRAGAERFARSGAGTDPDPGDWKALLAKARCQRRAGMLTAASQTIVAADKVARLGGGEEPDILVELGSLYFESEREIEAEGKRSAGNLFRGALEIHKTHEDALIAQFILHRFNRRRVSKSPDEILGEIFKANPDSVRGLVMGASADLEDGKLVVLRKKLARLDELAPKRRDVRTLHAALAWVEHRRDDCAAILEELLKNAPLDSLPERSIGIHLSELYRFAESIGFLDAATQRDPYDYEAWTELGKSLANTGDEDGAREALAKAEEAARGRRDAFRTNLTLVLDRIKRTHDLESHGALSFSWQPDAAEVLRAYLVPYYAQAREELSKRYGHTPGPTTIAIFRRLQDFSVRSVGFEGFPALGVCFGPVVTAVSPLSRLRGGFSWARTGFHEFSHVVHLGLSNNRCPRWITEGLATWEEVTRNPTWTRNMRRDLVDAYASQNLIPLRELNRAFRGPRILFGYYQGGLLCEMLIEEHGFQPMVRLLEAFNLGADLDQAFGSVFKATPEEVDAKFQRFVYERIKDLKVEPRWSARTARRIQIRLKETPPEADEARSKWADDWCTVAYGAWQSRRKVDAERAIEVLRAAGDLPPRALFLQGEIALNATQPNKARRLWKEAVAAGGQEYRAFIGLSQLALQGGATQDNMTEALGYLESAVEAFPGFNDGARSAERLLSDLHQTMGDEDAAMEWLEAWVGWNAGEYDGRMKVARWHVENGRDAAAVKLFDEANEVDMFRRDLHIAWGAALERLGRFEEAAREYRVALAVPPLFDPDHLVYVGPPERLPPGSDPANLPPGILGEIPESMLEPQPMGDEEVKGLQEAVARCEEAATAPK